MPTRPPRRSPRRRGCWRRAGRLLVVDFAAHEREELRERDAHIRLGFEDEVMAGWFAAAGLDDRPGRSISKGGELTVTLWRGVKAAIPQRRAA